MATLPRFLFCFLCFLGLAACGGSGGGGAAGHYELDKSGLLDSVPAAQRAMVQPMFDAMKITIDLNADGTARMQAKGAPTGDEDATGTWKLDGSKLTVTTKNAKGVEETKTVDYANNSFAFEEGEAGQTMKMVFRRK